MSTNQVVSVEASVFPWGKGEKQGISFLTHVKLLDKSPYKAKLSFNFASRATHATTGLL